MKQILIVPFLIFAACSPNKHPFKDLTSPIVIMEINQVSEYIVIQDGNGTIDTLTEPALYHLLSRNKEIGDTLK